MPGGGPLGASSKTGSGATTSTGAFFGGVAVLAGRVAKLRSKRAIAALVAGHDAVERIVNPLEVT